MRLTLENLALLRQDYPTLHSHILSLNPTAVKNVGGGFVDIDVSRLSDAQRKLLEHWVKDSGIHDYMNCACDDCFQKLSQRVAETEARETARLEAAQLEEDGIIRIQEYLQGRVPGFRALLDTPNNHQKFNALIYAQTKAGKQLGPALVDYTIDSLQRELDWEKPRTLPNGEPELRLDASKAEMNRASVEQLKDFWKRSNGQELLRKQTYAGQIRTNWLVDSSVRSRRQSQVR